LTICNGKNKINPRLSARCLNVSVEHTKMYHIKMALNNFPLSVGSHLKPKTGLRFHPWPTVSERIQGRTIGMTKLQRLTRV
jgi:hypothetical protein